jgi:hypothetical protein
VTPLGFLVALAVAVFCIGWIAVAGQPHSNWLRDHVLSWSTDLGIRDFVERITACVVVTASGVGALLSSAPGSIRRPVPVDDAGPGPAPDAERPVSDGDGAVVRERARV